MPLSTETFYSSSNGDRWHLVHDGETGRYAVRHEPNLSSGGAVSELAVPMFLDRSGTSPQAMALRELLHKQGDTEAGDDARQRQSPNTSASPAAASLNPARDFLLPRLTVLVKDAEAAGFPRDVAVAVLIDLVTSPGFDTATPDPKADSEPHNVWQRDQDSIVLVPGGSNLPPAIDARDEADFVKPFGGLEPS